MTGNTVTNVDVGLLAWGGAGGVASVTNNSVDGTGRPGSIGIYVTCGPDYWGSYQSNVSASFTANSVSNTAYGFYVETDETAPFFSTTVAVSGQTFGGTTSEVALFGLGTFNVSGLSGATVSVFNPGSIQLAVDLASPGAIVDVAAGTYSERLTIGKSLDLRGAQYGVDPTPSGARTISTEESIITEAGLSTPNPDVLIEVPSGVMNVAIDGFTLNGDLTNATADTSTVRCWDDNIGISNNIIDGRLGVLYKGNDGLNVESNRVTANKNGVVVQPNAATNVTIAGNTFSLGTTPAGDEAAVYLAACTTCSLLDNGATGFLAGRVLSASGVTNLTVTGNTFNGNRDALSIFGSSTFVTITDNDLSNSTRYGINIKGQDITIARNRIADGADTGIYIDKHTIDTQRVSISDNDLSGNANFGVKVNTSLVTEAVNASGNWWGSTDATTVRASSNAGAGVDYTPWLGGGTPMDPGFDGDVAELWVDDDSLQTGTTGRIQEGVNLVSGSTVHVAAGTYNENVVLNKALTLDGAGSGPTDTVITPPAGSGIVISAGGASASNRLTVQNLRVTGAPANGIDINASNASHLTFDNVACRSNGSHGMNTNPPTGSGNFADFELTDCDLSANGSTGLRVASYVGIDGLTIVGGHMDGNVYGVQTYTAAGNPLVTNVSVTGTTFNNNSSKGMYFENLDHAVFTGITVDHSGTVGAWAAGVDLNLKYHAFQDITFTDSTFNACGTGDPVNGVGLTIKARDDGGYATYPATLDNVQITSTDVIGCQEGMRFGEPGKNNAGPTNVGVHGCSLVANLLRGMRNESQAETDAESNNWGSGEGPADAIGTYEVSAGDCGPSAAVMVNADPVAALGNAVTENVDYCPWTMEAKIALRPQGGDACFKPGDTLVVEIYLSDVSTPENIVGGDFFLAYDKN